MNSSAVRNAPAAAVLALVGVLLVAAGFFAAIIVLDGNGADASPSTLAAHSTPPRTPTTSQPISGLVEDGALHSGIFDELIEILARYFVNPGEVDRQTLLMGGIRGLLAAIDDPHLAYLDRWTFERSQEDFRGAFEGIGATIGQQDGYVVIVAPLPDTPAERARLRAGDVILAVDGESAEGWRVEEATARIRGEPGTTVELRIRRRDGSEDLVKITRDEILVSSVSTSPPGGVLEAGNDNAVADLAYIRIHTFTERTPHELLRAIEQAGDVEGLILDLRSNPGGLLMATAQAADLFLDGGTMFMQVDRSGSEQVFNARPGTATDLPLVIIQDELSASGSELLAAALQENGRAIVVGANSFGKGTVSRAHRLSNGGAVYVSIARWLTPAGNLIEGRGVAPNVEVDLGAAGIEGSRDVALHRAIDALRAQIAAPEPVTL